MWLCYSSFLTLSFFANDMLLAVCFTYILYYGIDVRQKANMSDFHILVQNGS